MAKYVAVGVLAVIVLAALTYEAPEQAQTAKVAVEEEQLEGAYGGSPAPVDVAPLAERVEESVPTPTAPERTPSEELTTGDEPASSPASTTPVTVAASAGSFIKHTVQTGETLSDVAKAMLGSAGRWKEVYEYNRERIGESPNHVRVGLTLVFPSERSAPVASAPRATSPAPSTSSSAGGRSYTVQRGDTLYGIARAQLGSGPRWKEIASLNGLSGAELVAGKVLKLPAN